MMEGVPHSRDGEAAATAAPTTIAAPSPHLGLEQTEESCSSDSQVATVPFFSALQQGLGLAHQPCPSEVALVDG
jgi:hypothetical protein